MEKADIEEIAELVKVDDGHPPLFIIRVKHDLDQQTLDKIERFMEQVRAATPRALALVSDAETEIIEISGIVAKCLDAALGEVARQEGGTGSHLIEARGVGMAALNSAPRTFEEDEAEVDRIAQQLRVAYADAPRGDIWTEVARVARRLGARSPQPIEDDK